MSILDFYNSEINKREIALKSFSDRFTLRLVSSDIKKLKRKRRNLPDYTLTQEDRDEELRLKIKRNARRTES